MAFNSCGVSCGFSGPVTFPDASLSGFMVGRTAQHRLRCWMGFFVLTPLCFELACQLEGVQHLLQFVEPCCCSADFGAFIYLLLLFSGEGGAQLSQPHTLYGRICANAVCALRWLQIPSPESGVRSLEKSKPVVRRSHDKRNLPAAQKTDRAQVWRKLLSGRQAVFFVLR